MTEAMHAYQPTLVACAALAALIMVQVLVADYASIRSKHVPGMPITDGHASFLFRSSRALGNTNETLGLFLLVFGLAVLFAARAPWVNALVWAYVAGRAGHMLFYYLRQGLLRSLSFGLGLGATLGLLALTLMAAVS
jgi:uncharacterized MAPEG superfamily protein